MYQVIARKYRPQTFAELVNQEHVKSTLENAIVQNRIAHGYIFSGQRGTGKTTVARILARCLNCIEGPTTQPCGKCANCIEIGTGNAVDVIEIDAASNRGINEMRELRENVRYRPARDRYKVFIIDEAHQITNEAFNALLKTLEEPPEWVLFVLCTTEAHKIPATIASRCQQFSFRSVDFMELTARIRWICEQEGIEADDEALSVLAQAGEGSVRDSLSALDQAIACCGNKLDAAEIRRMLGAFSLDNLHSVTGALSSADSRRMLEIVDELERTGQNLQHFCRELSRYFRNLLVAQVAGADTRFIAASDAERRRLAEIAATFSEEDLTRYLQLTLDLYKDLQYSLQPRLHLEIGLLKMVQAGRLVAIEEALASLQDGGEPVQARGVSTTRSSVPPVSTPIGFVPKAPSAPVGRAPTQLVARVGYATPSQPPAQIRQASASPSLSGRPAEPEPAAVPIAAEGGDAADWKARLHQALAELNMIFTADALERSQVTVNGSELQIVSPHEFSLSMKAPDIQRALAHLNAKNLKVKISFADVAPMPGTATAKTEEDEVARRALSDPEVKSFREKLPGQVRAVRKLQD